MDSDCIIKVLKTAGCVVAIKTDTVYGLVCNAYDEMAVEKIYKLKNREKKKPISIFVKDIYDIYKYIKSKVLSDNILCILNKYWPGALTVIFDKKEKVFDYMTGGETLGVRIPDDDILLDILKKVDFPLAETSCNISGELTYKNALEIKEHFNDDVDLIVDGGILDNGIASTVIKVNGDTFDIIREGDIAEELKSYM